MSLVFCVFYLEIWCRFYENLPCNPTTNYKQQIIAQLESNIRKQLTFRVIKNVDLDLKTGDQVYITDDNNYSIAGVFEKDIPAINNTGDSTLC